MELSKPSIFIFSAFQSSKTSLIFPNLSNLRNLSSLSDLEFISLGSKINEVKEKTYHEKVYDITRQIPFGRFSTYGSIADYLHLGSARMVGWALNKIDFMDDSIPAHRVVNRKGELSGRNHFPTPETMQGRLEAEGMTVKNWTIQNYDKHYWHPEELDSM